ncbi:hypothetical protein JW887_03340 [Candidatus Dojkabacteria bacterium]|nr:hypothetical protein [Candidatus Dojkabacteria bacterium]
MNVNFQITKKFENDLKKFGAQDKQIITESINKYCSLLPLNGKRSRQFYQPHTIELTDNLDSSLYVLKVARHIRVILTIDEDPLFDQLMITLLRVVNTNEAEHAYTVVSQSLYQPILAHAR